MVRKRSSPRLAEIQQELATGTVEQKIDALLDAVDYGEAGLNLIIEALNYQSKTVREVAYTLLTESNLSNAQQALQNYLPYPRFDCLHIFTVEGRQNPNCLFESEDGQTLVSNCHDLDEFSYYYSSYSSVKIWNLLTGKLINSFPIAHDRVLVNFSANIFVSISSDAIQVWDLQTGSYIYKLHVAGTNGGVALSPDGQILVCANILYDEEKLSSWIYIEVWNLSSAELIQSLEFEELDTFVRKTSLLITPNGQTLLLSAFTTRCYDWKKWNSLFWERWEREDIIDTKPISKYDRINYWLWDWQTGELIHTFDSQGYWLAEAIAICPEGQIIACGISKKEQEKDNGIEIRNLLTDETIFSVAQTYSPSTMTKDGKIMIGCESDNTIGVWAIENQHKLCTLRGHSSPITHIALSSAPPSIASCSQDKTIQVWGLP